MCKECIKRYTGKVEEYPAISNALDNALIKETAKYGVSKIGHNVAIGINRVFLHFGMGSLSLTKGDLETLLHELRNYQKLKEPDCVKKEREEFYRDPDDI